MTSKQIVLNNSFFTKYIDSYVNPSNKQLKEWKEEHKNGDEKQKEKERKDGRPFGTYAWVLSNLDMGYDVWDSPNYLYDENCLIVKEELPYSHTTPYYKWMLDLKGEVLYKNIDRKYKKHWK